MKTTRALLFASLACACAHAPQAGRKGLSPADFYPLAIGNEWTYVDRSPTLAPSASAERTVRIVRRDAAGFFHDSQRGELRTDADCLRDRVRRLLCGPFELGKGWSSVVSETSTERYEIAAVGERVTTPAGAFDGCVRVRAYNRAGAGAQYLLETTYAPGVGVVKLESFAVVNGVVSPQVKAELRSYRLGSR